MITPLKQEAGIYIHIPFCRKACHYCDFHFSVSPKYSVEICRSMAIETTLRSDFFKHDTIITTIYFGGGTPSFVDPSLLNEIVQAIRNTFSCSPDAEITIEVNPEDCTEDRLKEWAKAGFNRLSIGIQSFRDSDLAFMNRNHQSNEATNSVLRAADAGFKNVSIDLIYGIPGLSIEDWKKNLYHALELPIQHLSAYCLTLEPRTFFGKLEAEKKWKGSDEEEQNKQFMILLDRSAERGFNWYEVSNFSLRGYESKHNRSYWQSKAYLGIGPSAHSFDGELRSWNIRSNQAYLQSLSKGVLPTTVEVYRPQDRVNEIIMTRLRTREGLRAEDLKGFTAICSWNDILSSITQQHYSDKVVIEENRITLREEGLLFADAIASSIFIS